VTHTVLWFCVVGAAAALTHLGVFTWAQVNMWPELANALGFGVAFLVSFVGHRTLSFQGSTTSVPQSLNRFGLTALAGFVANELVFVVLSRGAGLPHSGALLCAMGVAAVLTFGLSQYWAFRS
jgi:putative flippase GtrA